MYGFCINNSDNTGFPMQHEDNNTFVFREASVDGYHVYQATKNKFLADKCLYTDDKYLIVSEGVILNLRDLKEKYKKESIQEIIIEMYESLGERFFDIFRGSFSGAIYDRMLRRWIIYTNHYGDSALFYYNINRKYIVASQISFILEIARKEGVELSLNERAIENIITYGFMSDGKTFASEITRLLPGHYLVIDQDGLHQIQYYQFKSKDSELSTLSEDEIVDEFDKLFREAIRLEYEKDLEYGYRHLNQLSGGLDSRMGLWVARDMGYADMLCVTFGQFGSDDEIIAAKVAQYLNVDSLIWPLDSSKHLLNIDRNIKMNYGLAMYGGAGGIIEIFDALSMDSFGLVHTGQLGDVVLGSYVKSEKELSKLTAGGSFSKIISLQEEDNSRYFDREDYLMSTRGFLGILSSHLFLRNYSEVASPFLYKELFDFCMTIPVSLRANHYIYKKWILAKYPKAAEFVWEKTGGKITESEAKKNLRKYVKVIKSPRRLLRKLGFHIKFNLLSGMNPFDLWWRENPLLSKTYDQYFNSMIESPVIDQDIRKKLTEVYTRGAGMDKMLVITALGAIKFYFLS